MDIQNKYQDIGGYTQGHHRRYRGLGRPGGAGDHQARVRVHCQGGLEQADIVIKDQVDGFQCHCDEVLQRMMVSNQLAQGKHGEYIGSPPICTGWGKGVYPGSPPETVPGLREQAQ